MPQGLRLGAFAQLAFAPGAYDGGLMCGGLLSFIHGVFCHIGGFSPGGLCQLLISDHSVCCETLKISLYRGISKLLAMTVGLGCIGVRVNCKF